MSLLVSCAAGVRKVEAWRGCATIGSPPERDKAYPAQIFETDVTAATR